MSWVRLLLDDDGHESRNDAQGRVTPEFLLLMESPVCVEVVTGFEGAQRRRRLASSDKSVGRIAVS